MVTAVTQDKLNTVGALLLGTYALASGETGDALNAAEFADRSAQVRGTFGGASLVIEGSNDGTNYETLHDPFGNLLSFSLNGIKAVMELTLYIRPRVVGGDGTTAIAVNIFTRRQGTL